MSGFNTGGVLYVHGAYGRKASVDDWNNGKDFKIVFGPYCSIRDIKAMKAEGYTHVVIQNDTMNQNSNIVEIIELN